MSRTNKQAELFVCGRGNLTMLTVTRDIIEMQNTCVRLMEATKEL